MASRYTVYIVQCADGRLYTGITTDLDRRIKEHDAGSLSAKFTRGRGPVKVVYQKNMPDRAVASREEFRIKQLSRQKKLEMIQSNNKDSA